MWSFCYFGLIFTEILQAASRFTLLALPETAHGWASFRALWISGFHRWRWPKLIGFLLGVPVAGCCEPAVSFSAFFDQLSNFISDEEWRCSSMRSLAVMLVGSEWSASPLGLLTAITHWVRRCVSRGNGLESATRREITAAARIRSPLVQHVVLSLY